MHIILPILPLAFICELVDSSLGMGYGTTLTPILIILGYEPLVIVPSVLFSEFITGLLSGVFHQEFGNTNLRPGTRDFKITVVLSMLSILGVVIAVFITMNIPGWFIKVYIGIIVAGIGIIILLRKSKEIKFSWGRLAGLGTLAAFNKGISGGGYGPVVTGGQVLVGVEGRNAIAIAGVAEGITSAVGVLIFILNGVTLDPSLTPSLTIGAVLSVPVAAYIVSKISVKRITSAIGGTMLTLGSYTLLRLFL